MLFNATSFDDDLDEWSTGRALGSWKCAPGHRESDSHNDVLLFTSAEAEHPGRNVHLNVFKTSRSEAIRETGRLNYNHRVEQMQKAKETAITTICAGKDATWAQDAGNLCQ